MMDNLWVRWVTALQAIAQNGLTYCKDVFDKERYESLRTIASEITSHYSGINPTTVQSVFEQETGYATPKLDVRGAVFQEGKILLVKERSDGLWTLPGGWADVNETPSESVIKEIFEESGYETKVIKLIALYDKRKHPHPSCWPHVYKCFFLCEMIGGEATISCETSEVQFFDEEAIPSLSEGRVVLSQIKRCFIHYHNPQLATEFD